MGSSCRKERSSERRGSRIPTGRVAKPAIVLSSAMTRSVVTARPRADRAIQRVTARQNAAWIGRLAKIGAPSQTIGPSTWPPTTNCSVVSITYNAMIWRAKIAGTSETTRRGKCRPRQDRTRPADQIEQEDADANDERRENVEITSIGEVSGAEPAGVGSELHDGIRNGRGDYRDCQAERDAFRRGSQARRLPVRRRSPLSASPQPPSTALRMTGGCGVGRGGVGGGGCGVWGGGVGVFWESGCGIV